MTVGTARSFSVCSAISVIYLLLLLLLSMSYARGTVSAVVAYLPDELFYRSAPGSKRSVFRRPGTTKSTPYCGIFSREPTICCGRR